MTQINLRRIQNREVLMDAAEALFASYGYHGVTVRDITGLAKVRVAAVNDEFGSKDRLFYEVIKRRATEINAIREERLVAINYEASLAEPLHELIAGFFDPLLEKSEESQGWRNYLRLVAQMIGSRSPILLSVIEFYNPISSIYLKAIKQGYPHMEMADILRHWQFILATYFSIFSDNYRVDSLSQGKVKSSDFREVYEDATRFIHAGLDPLFADKRPSDG